MEKRRYGYTEWGMLLGILIGGGAAAVLYARTGQAFWFGLTGAGLALGLGLGAALDRRKDST